MNEFPDFKDLDENWYAQIISQYKEQQEQLTKLKSELEQAQKIDAIDIENYAVKTTCERILDEIAKPSGGRFGSELMNKIVDMVRYKDKQISRLKEAIDNILKQIKDGYYDLHNACDDLETIQAIAKSARGGSDE